MKKYDVLVIGAGHAGIEAAVASSRMGCRTLLVTMDKSKIGLMSCNPAIGGVGKGQLVKEIDALGGVMAHAADACGIQFRILNASKGPAVHSSRAQIDMELYSCYMRSLVSSTVNLSIKEAEAKALITKNNIVHGIVTDKEEEIFSLCVIVCPGTFLDGVIHIGMDNKSGGRFNERAAISLAKDLSGLGFRLSRFKTGTCPRLHKKSIDFSKLTIQSPDVQPKPFSFSTRGIKTKQVPCYITHTNKETHRIIAKNLDRSPLYAGVIKGTGVRYCPSIEDKIVKFPDRGRHQIFLEPEGLHSDNIYPNGLSTSLPEDIQKEMVHSIEGLKEARIVRFGYGIEHTVVDSTQLYPTLETKLIKNLYLAGQINGTTGYEEAGAQGLVVGINAALRARDRAPFILDRASSYIGVLIDDLVTKGTNEPYRMFTSRVEYRLVLREDNADLRLSDSGYRLGLISKKIYDAVQKKKKIISSGIDFLKETQLKPTTEINSSLLRLGSTPIKSPLSLEELLRRPGLSIHDLKDIPGINLKVPHFALQQIEIEVKYSGFIQRQLRDVLRFKKLEKIKIPDDFDYNKVNSLSRECREKLLKFRPLNLGQASRISGITPVAISLLMIYLKKSDG